MFDYIKGFLFLIIFILFLSKLGMKIKKSSFFCENLIYGFIIYTCFQFVGGFIAQFLRLPWLLYEIYMILTIILLTIFILYKNEWKVDYKKALLKHVKTYGIFYALALLFVVLSCMNIQYQWSNNMIDDGYYLNKVMLAPQLENYVDYNYATGFNFTESISRIVNTFEIEAAFFTNLLGIEASVFCKVFLAYFNYFLVLNGFYWLYITLSNTKEERGVLSLALIPMLFFGFYQEILNNFGLLYLQDSWQFNTAMWYGSSIVRHLGLVILIVPFLKNEKITIKKILFFLLSTVALVSKASQIFPVVCLLLLTYAIIVCLSKVGSNKKAFVTLIVILLALCIIPFSADLNIRYSIVYEQLQSNMGTFIVKVSILFIFLSYLLDIKIVRKWNNILLIFGLLLFVPRLNTIFLYTSMFDFVVARTITLYLFTVIITAGLYSFMLLTKVFNNRIKLCALYICIGCALIFVPLYSIQRNLGLKNTVAILAQNTSLIPEATIELSEKLEELKVDKQVDLYVLSPAWVVNNRTNHSLTAMLRYHAKDINVVSAIPRYNSVDEASVYATYDQEEQDIFEKYHSGEDQDDEKLAELLQQYPINCIVVVYNDVAEKLIDGYGYSLVEKVHLEKENADYYILYKPI